MLPVFCLQIKNVSKDALQGKLGKIYVPDQKVIKHLFIARIVWVVLDVALFAHGQQPCLVLNCVSLL